MMEKMKKLFQSAASKNGSYSVGMIALVICIVIVVNMIVGQLPENIRNIDISDNKIYEISETSEELLENLDTEITFTVYAEKSSTDERIKTFIDKYTSLTNKIDVEWVDPVLHPSELTENNVSSDTILISCEETGKSQTVAFTDIITYDQYTYYMTGEYSESEFDGEGQLTSAVNYVTSGESKKIYCTTGHGEYSFDSTVTDLFDKNNMETEDVNLIMENAIPSDCDLLFLYAPTADISDDEKTMIQNYMNQGGKVFVILGDMEEEAPNLDAILAEYGMQREEGYIADVERCYQQNYYYIFPEIVAPDAITKGLTSDMILLLYSHGMTITEPEREAITTTELLTTSSNAYAITDESQTQGTYTVAAMATEAISVEAESDGDEETQEITSFNSRITVVAAETLIDSQVTSAFASLENLDIFMNMVSQNFDDVENIAIEAKSLEITYNTMQHTGIISLFMIIGVPVLIVIYGFTRWLKRRKA